MESIKGHPEHVETVFGEAIVARDEALVVLAAACGLGPPDLCWLQKAPKSALTGASGESKGYYHYCLGVDASSSAAVAAYFATLTSMVESPTFFQGLFSTSETRIERGFYCCYDPLTRLDVRCELCIPGGVVCGALDCEGNVHDVTSDLWRNCVVASFLRSELYDAELVSYSPVPIARSASESRLLSAIAGLYEDGVLPGALEALTLDQCGGVSPEQGDVVCHTLLHYLARRQRWGVALDFFDTLSSIYPPAAMYVAAVQRECGLYDAALGTLSRAVEGAPGEALLLAALATECLYAEQIESAISLATKAVRLRPALRPAWLALARAHVRMSAAAAAGGGGAAAAGPAGGAAALVVLNLVPPPPPPPVQEAALLHVVLPPEPKAVTRPAVQPYDLDVASERQVLTEASILHPLSSASELAGSGASPSALPGALLVPREPPDAGPAPDTAPLRITKAVLAAVYTVLQELVAVCGWDDFLRLRASVFVMHADSELLRQQQKEAAERERQLALLHAQLSATLPPSPSWIAAGCAAGGGLEGAHKQSLAHRLPPPEGVDFEAALDQAAVMGLAEYPEHLEDYDDPPTAAAAREAHRRHLRDIAERQARLEAAEGGEVADDEWDDRSSDASDGRGARGRGEQGGRRDRGSRGRRSRSRTQWHGSHPQREEAEEEAGTSRGQGAGRYLVGGVVDASEFLRREEEEEAEAALRHEYEQQLRRAAEAAGEAGVVAAGGGGGSSMRPAPHADGGSGADGGGGGFGEGEAVEMVPAVALSLAPRPGPSQPAAAGAASGGAVTSWWGSFFGAGGGGGGGGGGALTQPHARAAGPLGEACEGGRGFMEGIQGLGQRPGAVGAGSWGARPQVGTCCCQGRGKLVAHEGEEDVAVWWTPAGAGAAPCSSSGRRGPRWVGLLSTSSLGIAKVEKGGGDGQRGGKFVTTAATSTMSAAAVAFRRVWSSRPRRGACAADVTAHAAAQSLSAPPPNPSYRCGGGPLRRLMCRLRSVTIAPVPRAQHRRNLRRPRCAAPTPYSPTSQLLLTSPAHVNLLPPAAVAAYGTSNTSLPAVQLPFPEAAAAAVAVGPVAEATGGGRLTEHDSEVVPDPAALGADNYAQRRQRYLAAGEPDDGPEGAPRDEEEEEGSSEGFPLLLQNHDADRQMVLEGLDATELGAKRLCAVWLDELIVALWHDLQAFLHWKALDSELSEAGYRPHAEIVAGTATPPSPANTATSKNPAASQRFTTGTASCDGRGPLPGPPTLPSISSLEWLRRGLLAERLHHEVDALAAYKAAVLTPPPPPGGVSGAAGSAFSVVPSGGPGAFSMIAWQAMMRLAPTAEPRDTTWALRAVQAVMTWLESRAPPGGPAASLPFTSGHLAPASFTTPSGPPTTASAAGGVGLVGGGKQQLGCPAAVVHCLHLVAAVLGEAAAGELLLGKNTAQQQQGGCVAAAGKQGTSGTIGTVATAGSGGMRLHPAVVAMLRAVLNGTSGRMTSSAAASAGGVDGGDRVVAEVSDTPQQTGVVAGGGGSATAAVEGS